MLKAENWTKNVMGSLSVKGKSLILKYDISWLKLTNYVKNMTVPLNYEINYNCHEQLHNKYKKTIELRDFDFCGNC